MPGNAISSFFAELLPPWAGYDVAGDPGPAFITAFAPAGSASAKYFGATTLWDVAQTSVGGEHSYNTEIFGNKGFNKNGVGIESESGLKDTVYMQLV